MTTEWETHCDECGAALVDDPDWKDERHCHPCNLVYLHPTTVAELERRIASMDRDRRCEACDGTGEWGPQYGEPPVICSACAGTGRLPALVGDTGEKP